MSICKKELQISCIRVLKQHLSRLEEMMTYAQQEANKETKSSAGDKYETGRSMMQLEKEKYAMQHSRVSTQLTILQRLDLGTHEEVREGSLVDTNIGRFFIAVGMEPQHIQNEPVTCISLSTPIGMCLEGLEAGDVVDFRGQEIEIWEVS